MDYKSKYLHYKKLYLDLKLKGGELNLTRKQLENFSEEDIVYIPDEYYEDLKKIYPTTKFDESSLKHIYPTKDITYGEMNYEGINILVEHLHTMHKISFKNFLDIGSGRGKIPLHIAALPNVTKSVGIELVKERHDDAEEIKEQLNKYKNIVDKVTFINDDIKNIDLTDHINDITLVWISNKCFPSKLNDKIFSKLLDVLPKDSIISCSEEYSSDKLNKIDNIKVPMSWYSDSDIFIYRIV